MGRAPSTRVLCATLAALLATAAVPSLEAGAVAYVQKPVDTDELLAAIDHALH